MQTRLMQLLLLTLISTHASFCLAAETYWVAYTGEPRAESGSAVPGGPKYLMKIDVLGNVLIPPTKVVPNASGYLSPLGGAIALTKAGNTRLAMWFPHKREVRDGYPIYKAVVQKSTLRVLSLERTKLRTINTESLSTTQRLKRNFIVLQILEELSSTDELDAFSIRNPSRAWLVQALVSGYSSSFAVSADGKLLFFSNHDAEKSRENLFIQFLSAEGLPFRNPQFIAHSTSAVAMDVTSILSQSRRYLFYTARSPLLLQVVDAKTGKKIGDKIRIGPRASGFAALDPRGHFVLFTSPETDDLFFQALDATGHPSGTAKVIAHGIGSRIDILKD